MICCDQEYGIFHRPVVLTKSPRWPIFNLWVPWIFRRAQGPSGAVCKNGCHWCSSSTPGPMKKCPPGSGIVRKSGAMNALQKGVPLTRKSKRRAGGIARWSVLPRRAQLRSTGIPQTIIPNVTASPFFEPQRAPFVVRLDTGPSNSSSTASLLGCPHRYYLFSSTTV